MDAWQSVALGAGGLASGFLNTLAGGGSVISLPLLEWVTGSAAVANATNRIAILFQNVAAVAGFHTGRAVPFRLALRLVPVALLGALLGAWLAVSIHTKSLRLALSLAVVFVAVSAVVRPPRTPPLRGFSTHVAFLLVGFYIGFLQVGVGFLLLACLAGGLGLDLVRANAAKVFLVLLVTGPTLVIFGMKGQLRLYEGCILSLGNMLGAWLASRLAIERGSAWVRVVVFAAALVAIVKLLLFPSGPG